MGELLVKSIAVGGPLHGVQLEAVPSWDGIIRKPRKANAPETFHPGRYKLVDGSWLWFPGANCDEFSHKWKYGARMGEFCYCGKRARR